MSDDQEQINPEEEAGDAEAAPEKPETEPDAATVVMSSRSELEQAAAEEPAEEDGWVSAGPAVAAPPAQKAAPAAESAGFSDAPAAAPPASESFTGDTAVEEENILGGVGNTLAKIGIKGRTGQWIAVAVLGLVVLCCACSCIGVIISLATGNLG